jgi:CRISPR/Cas system-associated exonuclease Cas4 (RecB family)
MTFSIERNQFFTNRLISNLRERYSNNKRKQSDPIHVSDLLYCPRFTYYARKFPDENVIDEQSMLAFVRGESSEYAIVKLFNMGVGQAELELDGIVGHADIKYVNEHDKTNPDSYLIIELKDSVGARIDITNSTFRRYLKQLIYYLCMSDITKGILSIKYNSKSLTWVKRDSAGKDWYVRSPSDPASSGIESWSVYLSSDASERELFKQELLSKKDLLVNALKQSKVEILPRLRGKDKIMKCKNCAFRSRCWETDAESLEGMMMIEEQTDLLDGIEIIVNNNNNQME